MRFSPEDDPLNENLPYRAPAQPLQQPTRSHTELTYYEFLMRCERDGVKASPVGAFEKGGYLGPKE